MNILLETCQIDKDNLHKWRSMECMDLGEAINNVTLKLKPLKLDCRAESMENEGWRRS